MERRDFLQKSSLGLLAVPAQAQTPAANARVDVVNAADLGAVGDGKADDTKALQSAIDAALAQGKPCFIPSGFYRTTAPLVVGNGSGPQMHQGFSLYGTGTSTDGKSATLIRMSATGQSAVLKFERDAWRRCEVRDLAMGCDSAGAADFGLLFDSTEFSNHTVRNVVVFNVKTAFAIQEGTGRNGEFILFENCKAAGVDTFFYSNAGQAYVQSFFHCTCTLNRGGTYFNLDLPMGGGGLHVTDFNATGGIDKPGVSNTTLVSSPTNTSVMNFFGGRIEHLTQLYSAQGNGPSTRCTANFCGMQFTLDSERENPELTKPHFIDIAAKPDILTIQSCEFYSGTNAATIDIAIKGTWTYILFKGCDFEGLLRPPYVSAHWSERFSQIRYEDCKTSTVTAPPGHGEGIPLPFDRYDGRSIGVIGRRLPFSVNARLQSGRPQNLLVRPEFAFANGRAVVADAPWIPTGATKTIGLSDWNGDNPPESAAPWARALVVAPASGLYQDIAAIDLSSKILAVELSGNMVTPVYYQAAITFFGGGSRDFKFELTDSVQGVVYDGRYFVGDGHAPPEFGLVTLGAYIKHQDATAYPRLKIENLDPQRPLEIHFAWQKIVAREDASFAPSSLAAVSDGSDWDGSVGSLRSLHRFALPYVSDSFGKAARRTPPDMASERYQSADTEREQAWQTGRWWDRPLQTLAAEPPNAGRWPYLSQVWNSAVAAGGTPGWIQVASGDVPASAQWNPGTVYVGGARVYRALHVYDCIQGGTSAGNDGPAGTGEKIQDGTAIWRHAGTLAPVACARAWAAGSRYDTAGTQVANGKQVYELAAAGRSADAGGPSGTGHRIADGSCVWRFLGRAAIFKAMAKLES